MAFFCFVQMESNLLHNSCVIPSACCSGLIKCSTSHLQNNCVTHIHPHNPNEKHKTYECVLETVLLNMQVV